MDAPSTNISLISSISSSPLVNAVVTTPPHPPPPQQTSPILTLATKTVTRKRGQNILLIYSQPKEYPGSDSPI